MKESLYFPRILPRKIIAKCFLFILLTTTASLSKPVWAVTIRGVEFEEKIKIEGKELALHGVGLLKWKYLLKVYQVALYKPKQVPVTQILEKDAPKRLEYYFFIDMKASDFQDTGFELMARNVGREKAESLSTELKELNRLYRDVNEGQRYTLTYLPGMGLEMALDGKVLGRVDGDEFAVSYLSIWLGPDPVSEDLKEGMFNPETVR